MTAIKLGETTYTKCVGHISPQMLFSETLVKMYCSVKYVQSINDPNRCSKPKVKENLYFWNKIGRKVNVHCFH